MASTLHIIVQWAKPQVEIFTAYNGSKPQIAASYPTGAYAAYQSAIDENLAEAQRKVDAYIAERRKLLTSYEITVEVRNLEDEA